MATNICPYILSISFFLPSSFLHLAAPFYKPRTTSRTTASSNQPSLSLRVILAHCFHLSSLFLPLLLHPFPPYSICSCFSPDSSSRMYHFKAAPASPGAALSRKVTRAFVLYVKKKKNWIKRTRSLRNSSRTDSREAFMSGLHRRFAPVSLMKDSRSNNAFPHIFLTRPGTRSSYAPETVVCA